VAADLTIAAVIPLYNGRKFILDAIDSVLEQTRPPQDIIVVDDGSTDDGPTIVEQFVADGLVRLLRKENGGQSSARNLGVAHAETDLIALLDQDDLWYPDHLAELVKPFMKRKSGELGWVYSNLDEIDENGLMTSRAALSNAAKTHPKRDINACLRQDMFVLPSASLISRAASTSGCRATRTTTCSCACFVPATTMSGSTGRFRNGACFGTAPPGRHAWRAADPSMQGSWCGSFRMNRSVVCITSVT